MDKYLPGCGDCHSNSHNSGDEDDSEDSDDKEFNQAAAYLPQIIAKGSASNDDLLYLYARFKQVTTGPCNTKRPGFLEIQARKKWDAWKSLKEMNEEEARSQYIEKILQLDPSWDDAKNAGNKAKTAGSSWVSVSTMPTNEEVLPDEQKTVYDWCQEGNINSVTKCLKESHLKINFLDEGGMSLLHWACDRGHTDIVKLLIKHNADVNLADSEGQTPLHYACACSHAAVVKLLLDNKANPMIQDNEGDIPADLAEEEAVKLLLTAR